MNIRTSSFNKPNENGNALSGGERQRISIARSLLKKSKVLLSDEATASLDAKTAASITDAILNFNSVTRIVITHSLEESILKRFDCIIAFKDGKIEEYGNFEELMKKKNCFYSLYNVSK